MNSPFDREISEVEIPVDILELVTNHGQFSLPSSVVNDRSVVTVRLRSYWGRLADLALGRTDEAERWLDAYNWAVRHEIGS